MSHATPFLHLQKTYEKQRSVARALQLLGNELTRLSKTVIFALQRNQPATKLLRDAERVYVRGQNMLTRTPALSGEGAWHAGCEEYAEARLLEAFVRDDAQLFARILEMDVEIVLGALSDLVGELARLAVREATQGRGERVGRIADDAERIVQFLTSLDLTGSLRSKGDQARQHIRKIEDIRYDLSVKRRV